MPIRLLKKDEIQKAISIDKSKEIAEGLKISRRVDSLRELQSKTEESLEKFRIESLTAIRKEIDQVNTEKEILLSEVKELRSEKLEGLKEIDKRQKELDSYEESLDTRLEQLIKKGEELEEKEKQVLLNLKNSKNELLRASNHKEIAQNLHRKSIEDQEKAVLTLVNAEKVEKQVFKFKEEKETELYQREKVVVSREKDIESREESLIHSQKDLREKELQLIDRENTLEIEFNRLRKT